MSSSEGEGEGGTLSQIRPAEGTSNWGTEDLIRQNICPECAQIGVHKQYKSAAPLGKHRKQVHGVESARASSKEPKAKAQPKSAEFDASKFLKLMFPNGIPADHQMVLDVGDWLTRTKSLWNRSMKSR